ncbi:MAG TPA: hypothetical protein VG474_17410 [Solirubrobacteraceae bacterium]|nr:hypothetical protein [Solirubrobacteraceae bacterium]
MLVKRVDDLAHVRLVGPDERGDLRDGHPRGRRPHDQRALTLGFRRRLTRQPLEPVALLRQQLERTRRGTHRHLQITDASTFDIDRGVGRLELEEDGSPDCSAANPADPGRQKLTSVSSGRPNRNWYQPWSVGATAPRIGARILSRFCAADKATTATPASADADRDAPTLVHRPEPRQ